MRARILILCGAILLSLSLIAQEKEPRLYATNLLTTRFMQTTNQGTAEDFSILVTWIKPTFHYRFTDWLSIHGASVVLLNYGTNSIKKRDAVTGNGPIYEGNLWNQRLMNGSVASSLPELHLDFSFGAHFFRIGRFVETTPAINVEAWPFPNALEGIWYKFDKENGLKFQLGLIDRISPRFGEHFFDVGNSIGTGPIGVGSDGLASQYRGNVNSNYMSILNLTFPIKQGITFSFWNYQVEEVSTTLFAEAKFDLNKEKGLKLAVQS
uniref:hypothetical protein n=1 Tax=Roseivirga sp. TaxID=1964215 RepID=UPI004048998B